MTFTEEQSNRMKAAIDLHLSGGNAEPEFRAIYAELEPVDPMLVEAREIVAKDFEDDYPEWARYCREGAYDKDRYVRLVLAGLQRGLELAGEQ